MDTPVLTNETIATPELILIIVPHSKDKRGSQEQLERLLRSLDRVGLDVECRYGGKGTVIVFVKCPASKMKEIIWRSRYFTSSLLNRHD
jgi:hypothetical protein